VHWHGRWCAAMDDGAECIDEGTGMHGLVQPWMRVWVRHMMDEGMRKAYMGAWAWCWCAWVCTAMDKGVGMFMRDKGTGMTQTCMGELLHTHSQLAGLSQTKLSPMWLDPIQPKMDWYYRLFLVYNVFRCWAPSIVYRCWSHHFIFSFPFTNSVMPISNHLSLKDFMLLDYPLLCL